MIKNKLLFNFSVSYLGGGYKRLYAYADWFNQRGGAWFIIHSSCRSLVNTFPGNRFFIVSQSKFQRFFNDCNYLDDIQNEIGIPEFYYSYGIPIYKRLGRMNWFHLTNVLPLYSKDIPLSGYEKLKFATLGRRIEKNYKNADVISAESQFSLGLINSKYSRQKFLSVNGSDDELGYLNLGTGDFKREIATVLGTVRYKALDDSYCVFEMLKKNNSSLKMMVIGDERHVPKSLHNNKEVIIAGLLNRNDVFKNLVKTKFYISTTYIENSYNAASEGIFFADESFISDIGPHRELLQNIPHEQITVPKMTRPILHVKKKDLVALVLNNWDKVIREMINHAELRVE